MIWLRLTIAVSVLVFLLFNLFLKHNINILGQDLSVRFWLMYKRNMEILKIVTYSGQTV